MNITFQITYRTQWGETMCIIAKSSTEFNWTEASPLELSCHGQDFWTTTIELKTKSTKITYRYAIKRTDGTFFYEDGKERQLLLDRKQIIVRDFWQIDDYEKCFNSKVFTQALFKRHNQLQTTTKVDSKTTKNIHLTLTLPQVLPNQGVAVMGNTKALGEWRADQILPMSDAKFPLWETTFRAQEDEVIEYKYLIYDLNTKKIIDLEGGENRQIWGVKSQQTIIINDRAFRRTQPRWKGAGVAIPVFSLRSEDSFGIGEFQDLRKMADWAAKVGIKMIQTLPINDTTLQHTDHDSYPYKAVSVFALHPIYINIEKIGKFPLNILAKYKQEKAIFNQKTFVDYQNVYNAKTRYFKLFYEKQKTTLFKSENFITFFNKNKEWLESYATFMAKRDKQPKEYYYFLQYHADKQLKDAVNYAHSQGIAMKGDIPIGIAANSVDAKQHPELFNLQTSAGAPPDAFDTRGQNWGFPTYNWEEMAKDNYDWWRRRFTKMQDYFDAYRIDHILGFFRIWQMPKSDVWGLCGHFVPALPYTSKELWNMGIRLDEDRLTKPYIRNSFLRDIFGKDTERIKRTYFETKDGNSYCFKEAYDTQVKVQAKVKNLAIREKLMRLHCDVLFVHDQSNSTLLHPRIALQQTYSYKELWAEQKQLLSAIHDDYFYRRHSQFWKESALRKLPTLINATDMLVCGEDLGMVPDCVPEVMQTLQILSLEIQRMPKVSTIDFAHPSNAPYLSVCTTGTHDMNPLRAWWEENKATTQKFYNQQMGILGEAPNEMTPEIARFIINQHIYSQAMWVILPLQDWLAIDNELRISDSHSDRINVPSNPNHFWNYRMHLTLENLLTQDKFNTTIRELISPRL